MNKPILIIIVVSITFGQFISDGFERLPEYNDPEVVTKTELFEYWDHIETRNPDMDENFLHRDGLIAIQSGLSHRPHLNLNNTI